MKWRIINVLSVFHLGNLFYWLNRLLGSILSNSVRIIQFLFFSLLGTVSIPDVASKKKPKKNSRKNHKMELVLLLKT
jgi:hypothetical protein